MTTEIEFIHLLRARVSHEMAQFMLKIAHLVILMEPTRLLEKVSSYGLLPRIWLLIFGKRVLTMSAHYYFGAWSRLNFWGC